MEPANLGLNLSFIFPGGTDDFTISYVNGKGVPIPTFGDLVGCKSGGYKVTARVFNYDSVGVLTIDITCG